ncbi:MAG: hypothetical protein ACRDGK_05935, partial [Actinomycetota bacterium]
MQRLIGTIDERAAPDRRDAISVFAKIFLRRLSGEDIEESGVEGLFGLVRSAFEFTDVRGLHASTVRI